MLDLCISPLSERSYLLLYCLRTVDLHVSIMYPEKNNLRHFESEDRARDKLGEWERRYICIILIWIYILWARKSLLDRHECSRLVWRLYTGFVLREICLKEKWIKKLCQESTFRIKLGILFFRIHRSIWFIFIFYFMISVYCTLLRTSISMPTRFTQFYYVFCSFTKKKKWKKLF